MILCIAVRRSHSGVLVILVKLSDLHTKFNSELYDTVLVPFMNSELRICLTEWRRLYSTCNFPEGCALFTHTLLLLWHRLYSTFMHIFNSDRPPER